MAPFTSPSTRARIISLKDQGLTDRAVAEKLGKIHFTTVNKVYRDYRAGRDIFAPKPRSGRPRVLGTRSAQYGALVLSRGLVQSASDLQREFFPDVSVDTVRRRLKELGWRAYRRRRVPHLTTKRQRRRLVWGHEHRAWSVEQWKRVGFSDEKKFVVYGRTKTLLFWKKRRALAKPSDHIGSVKYGGGHIMVWGYITSEGVGELYLIEGTMNTSKYTEILDKAFLGSLAKFYTTPSDIIFQHDNDPKHTSRGTRKWLAQHEVQVLPWPASSPDMNLIEHVWAYLELQVRSRRPAPQNRHELWLAVKEEWEKIPPSFITKLYDSMHKRVEALIKAKGGHTMY
jgi:transposase